MKRIITFFLLIFCFATMSVNATTQSDYTLNDYEINDRFEDCIIINGVDVSIYQDTSSDWRLAKENGIDFAILRVTLTTAEEGLLKIDKNFEEHFKNAKEAGIMCGVYVFSQAKNSEEAREEAEFAIYRLQQLGIEPQDLDLPIYMDYEFYKKDESRLKNLSKYNAISSSRTFCETVAEYGYDAGVYANTSFMKSYLENGIFLPKGTSIWCAQYNIKNDSSSKYSIWQYSSHGIVPNIYSEGTDETKGVDVNFWFVDSSVNPSSKLDIYAETNVQYTGQPVLPYVEIFDGTTQLVENEDYVIRGINNINIGSEAYAYIKGINDYEGYALIPINIQNNFPQLPLPITSLKTSYKFRDSIISEVDDDTLIEDFLSNVKLDSDGYSLEVLDSQCNIKMPNEVVEFSDMVGVFKDAQLIGTIEINLKSETQINYLIRR